MPDLPDGSPFTEERRNALRLPVVFEIKYFLEKDPSEEFMGRNRNIDAGGLSFSTDQLLNKDDVIGFHFILPEYPPPIRSSGKVVWAKSSKANEEKKVSYEVGVQFVHLAEHHKSMVAKYLHSLLWHDYLFKRQNEN